MLYINIHFLSITKYDLLHSSYDMFNNKAAVNKFDVLLTDLLDFHSQQLLSSICEAFFQKWFLKSVAHVKNSSIKGV